MDNIVLKLSIRTDMKDKAAEEDRQRSGAGWINTDLSLDDFKNHIKNGYPFTHQFSGGRRKKENFLGTNVLVADIDESMRLEDALQNTFVKEHATLIYTTPSHTLEQHRFRIIFRLNRAIFDAESYEALYLSLMKEIPTDPATKSCAQFFFGNSQAEFFKIGKSLPDKLISAMVSEGMNERYQQQGSSLPPETLLPDTHVYVKGKGLQELGTLKPGTSIQCPFGLHPDKNPSAFVKVNKDGARGVECRACGTSAWVQVPPPAEREFGYFDRMVKQYHGIANSHFDYLGVMKFDHDLETSMEKSNFHIFTQEKLGSLPLLPGVNLIKSPKGSGKTHALSKLVESLKDPAVRKAQGLKPSDRVILVGHRQALIRESAAKLGLECYLDTGGHDTLLTRKDGKTSGTLKPPYYAICLDSLAGRVRPNLENYGVLIIDESEQVFSHFLSEHMKSPKSNFDALSLIMKQCRFVYCLDADLDTITLTGVAACLGRANVERERDESYSVKSIKKLYCHLNTYKPPPREIQLYVSKNHLLDELRKSLAAGKRCYVVSNSKKFIEGQYKTFCKGYPRKKFRMFVSEQGDDSDNIAFLKNIRSEILNYDAILTSPTLGTGIDITFPNDEVKIDCVFGFFEHNINTHFDIDQQVGRVRRPGEIKVWVTPVRGRFSTDRQRILNEIIDEDHVKGLRYFFDYNGLQAQEGAHPFLDLVTEVTAVRRRSMNRLRRNFISHRSGSGWKVVEIKADPVSGERGSIINKAGRAQQRKATIERIMQAEPLELEQVLSLKKKKDTNQPLTDAEKASQKKHYLEEFYRQEVTPDLIKLDDDGKLRTKIRILEALLDKTLEFTSIAQWTREKERVVRYKGRLKKDILEKAIFLRETRLSNILSVKSNRRLEGCDPVSC